MTPETFPQRQIHLDFHTSPFIPGVASEFDAQEFAQTFKRAHVDSVTVFGKCHHGMCYYPTQTGTIHPHLNGRDLLGEQIEALHREGIRAPIYTTVVWEEDVAQKHPEWRQLRADGTFAGSAFSTDERSVQPGRWKWNSWLQPDYQDYMEAHLREVLERYGSEVDGIFFDILMLHPSADWSDAAMQFRREHGFLGADKQTHAHFESEAQRQFCDKFSAIVHGLQPKATTFYNSGHHLFSDSRFGSRARLDASTHFEVESLPSGFWGYAHFPRMARLVENWRKDDHAMAWLAMTGRFQRQWGDFGGIKPQPALEYECFRAQALGGANSVGDQLPPRGILDPAAYDLIGAVFEQCEAAQPFYKDAKALSQIGVIYPGAPGHDEGQSDKSIEGAIQMCEETHYECSVLDDACDFVGYDCIILPDDVVVSETLRTKLEQHYAGGGMLLVSHESGRDENGKWALPFELQFEGEAELFPTFWRAHSDFDADLSRSDRVFYEQGLNVHPDGLEVLVERVPPYFQRTDVRFCSHFQTPPVKESGEFPAVVAGERFVYFADPIFREYRQKGNTAARDGWKSAMQRLVGAPPFGAGLPTTILSVPRRRNDDLILTLLHYIPVRKALEIDIIEERMSFAGETLRLPAAAQTARIFNGADLPRDDDGFLLPPVKGRLLIEVPGYFAS